MTLKLSALLMICCGLLLPISLRPSAADTSARGAPVQAASDEARAADREAIRAHIDKIFKAYIERDCGTIRATHAQNWTGFTGGARSIIRGLDEYMNSSAGFCLRSTPRNPNAQGLTGYKISEIDYTFYGDVALVPYVAETTYGPAGNAQGKLRSLDVYAKVDGEWNQVGSNIYLHPDSVQEQLERAQRLRPLAPPEQQALMAAREAVWRAFFAGDQARLEQLIPEEALIINGSGEEPIGKRASILEAAKKSADRGSKLVRLEFPRTEMQVYGDTAILYTTYLLELENARGQRATQTGRGTEIFVRRKGVWINTGWHLQPDNEKRHTERK